MRKGFPITSVISTVATFQTTPLDRLLQPCPFTSFRPWEQFPLLTDSWKTLKNLLRRLSWPFRPASSTSSSSAWQPASCSPAHRHLCIGDQQFQRQQPSSLATWAQPTRLTIGLYSLIRGRKEPVWIGLAGFSLAFAVICRPTDLLLILPLGAYVMLYHRPQMGKFLLGVMLPGLFQLWYNYAYFGDPFFQPYGISFWSTPLMEGLGGILVSPGRGLFVYSPILLCSFLGMALAWRCHGDPLIRALSVGILPTLLLYGKWISWWGGWSYGPRLLADLTPILSICLVPCVVRLDTIHRNRLTILGGRWLFLALALWSIWAHAIGALWDDGRWNASPNIDLSLHRLWSVGSSP